MVRYSLDGTPPYFGSIKELRAHVIEMWNAKGVTEGGALIVSDGKPYAHMARLEKGDRGYDALMAKADTDTVYWRGCDDIPDVCSPVHPDGSIGKDVDLRTDADGKVNPSHMNDKVDEFHIALTEKDGKVDTSCFFDLGDLRRWSRNDLLKRRWVVNNPDIKVADSAPAVMYVHVVNSERTPEALAIRVGEDSVIWGAEDRWQVIDENGRLGRSVAYPGAKPPSFDVMLPQESDRIMLTVYNGLSIMPAGDKEMSEAEVNAYTKWCKVQSMEEKMFKDPDLVKDLAMAVKRDLAKYPPEIVAEVVCDKGRKVLADAHRVLAGGKGSECDSVFAFAASLEAEVIKRMEERGLELDGKIHNADEFIDLVDSDMKDKLMELATEMDKEKNEKEGGKVKAEKSKDKSKDRMTEQKQDDKKERADRLYGLNVLAHMYFNASALENDISSLESVPDIDGLEAVRKCAAELKAMLGKAYDRMFAEQLKKV